MNRIFVAAGAAFAVVVTAVGAAVLGASDAKAGTRAAQGTDERDLVVTLVTPTLNQEVLPDLSDPGLNKVITVRFSSPLRGRDFIDNRNVFNRLTPNVEFVDSSFLRLSGEPQVVGNVFRFDPLAKTATGTLTNGQYTLSIKSSVRNTKGNQLNAGGQDFSTTFSVGTDTSRPVLRRASPINNQQNISLQQRIVLTFNEPILGSSVLSTITVQNASTNPPVTILGKGGGNGVTLERNGFDVVFTPDPCFGYPPRTTIQMLVQAQPIGATTTLATVTDVFGNRFTRDSGLQWTFNQNTGEWVSPNGSFTDLTGVFKLQFVTKGVTLPPVLYPPGSPQFVAGIPFSFTGVCGAGCWLTPICKALGLGIYYTTGNGIGMVDLLPFYILRNANIADFSQFTTIANAPVRLGRITGMAVDPRWDVNTNFHTFVYAADTRSASVLVLDSRSFKVIGRFTGFQTPQDVSVSTDFRSSTTRLLVADTAANQVVLLDLQTIAITFGGQPGAQSPCDAIKDTKSRRQVVAVGKGPTNVFADGYLNNIAGVCNTLENSVTILDIKQAKVKKTHASASAPVEGDFSYFGFGAIDVACIACQGGLRDPDGAVSVYVRGGNRDGIEGNFTDGVKNPTAVWATQQYADCSPGNYGNSLPTQQWFVSNTGGDEVFDLRLSITGGFGVLVTVTPGITHDVGLNPTGAMYDGAVPYGTSIWVACGGLGQFGGMSPTSNTPPELKSVPGVRRLYTCYTH